MSSVSIDAQRTTLSLSEPTKLQAPFGKSLCARSLAALGAASPSTTSCSIRNKGTTSDASARKQAHVQSSRRARGAASSQSASTDEGSFSDPCEDSTSLESPIEWCLADFTDSSGTDSEGLSADDSVKVAAKKTTTQASASVAVYSVALLLQLRASICRASSSSLANTLGYGTRLARQCPVVADAEAKHVQVGSCERSVAAKPSWSSQRKQAQSQDDKEQVGRAARSILNKLTIEKFDALYEQLATCGVKSLDHVKILMHEIFEKATVQHHFLGMYADLCVKLESDPRIAPAVKTEGRSNAFRHLLLAQCQSAFEQQFDSAAHSCDGIDEEEMLVRKQRALGNIKFVGKLLVRGMLSSRLFVTCAEELLSSQSACNESLESLAALLTVAGGTFDDPRWPHIQRLEAIFARIAEIVHEKKVPARVRFLLRDVLDLRKARWSTDGSPPSKQGAGPMRLDEIRASVPQSPSSASNAGSNMSPVTPKQPKNSAPSRSKTEKRQAPPICVKETPVETAAPAPTGRRASGAHRRAAQANKAAAALAPVASELVCVDSKPVTCVPTVETTARAEPAPVAAPVGDCRPAVTAPTAALEPVPVEASSPKPFCMKAFRRELSAIMKELSSHRNVAIAVRQIRAQQVPVEKQAKEFADLITRAAEESRGPARRTAFAFCGGLAAAEESAFDRAKCLAGVSIFFTEIYEDLCEDVSKLPAIVTAELLPTLQSVLPHAELNEVLPKELQFRVRATTV